MVVTIKSGVDKQQFDTFIEWTKDMGLSANVIVGEKLTIVGLVGDTSSIDLSLVRSISIVEDVHRIQEPYKNANRKMHPEDTIIDIGGTLFGEGYFNVISGPCSVESAKQICLVA